MRYSATIGILLLAVSMVAGGLAQPIQGNDFSLVLTILVLTAWGLHPAGLPNYLAACQGNPLLPVTGTITGALANRGHPAPRFAEVRRHSRKDFLSMHTSREFLIASHGRRTS